MCRTDVVIGGDEACGRVPALLSSQHAAAMATRLPSSLLHAAKRTFLREVRFFKKFLLSSEVDEHEVELETDFEEVVIATDVTPAMVPEEWEQTVGMVLDRHGELRMTSLRDTTESNMTSQTLESLLIEAGNDDSLNLAPSTLISPPDKPRYYVQSALTIPKLENDPYLVTEVDFGYHSMGYWLDRARTYLLEPRVGRVLIVQFFPLRRSAVVAKLYKRAALAVVLGRVATTQGTSGYEVCIFEEKSFGNAPLAMSIRRILATVPTTTAIAPRADLHFDEPVYAAIPIPLANSHAAHYEVSVCVSQHPHLLTIPTGVSAKPWGVNLGEVFSDCLQGWTEGQSKRRA